MNSFGNLANGVFGQAAKQLGGVAKHAVKRIVREPLEVIENAVGAGDKGSDQENQAMEAVEQGGPPSAQGAMVGARQGDDAGKPQGFKTQQDYQKYQQLSGNKDQLELNLIRKKLAQEWGVDAGMEAARREYEQKEQERKQVEEKEEEQEKMFEFEQKKADDAQLAMAKNAASAEKRMAVAG